ncbi:SubName: Full=Related to TGF beta induced protein ig-h3 {ECO:0000313/EMBL:CCA69644.1} [Serendipita indica DSM 11827]|uniref:Related to TGF beta induced protein ig-h3 n=1 Tax=Serendipita indica (strain DSM 11827) TaxID=1109443 RepID=G4TEA1_SERID|nr:SubName: Full=Related to TGF beta induced protein ig-h3 {ECO:0000313/EMBL:CCA69644.1} [Serendipita indica DSM 11827]CCA69644.1 related to TGF beta induced protein ig-h3 precursor [Serendipita indica DSM 11827]
MHLPHSLSLLFLAGLVAAQDNGSYAEGLTQALNGAGLTSLATALGAAPASLLSALQQGNHTVFAPTNDALSGVNPTQLPNIADILAYHVTAGVVDTDKLNETPTVVRSSLGSAPAVELPANQTQVLVVGKANNGTVFLENNGRNVQVAANATYANLRVLAINRVLSIPANISTVAAQTSEISALVGAVTSAAPQVLTALVGVKGLTLFAPNNAAIQAVASQLPNLNQTTLTNVLLNHVINGTAVYSTGVTDGGSAISAGGEELKFAVNSSGAFVTSGNSTAKIVQTNILTSNGVIHLIDSVLLNTQSNPEAATSAFASASSAQASQTATQTGPVTGSGNGSGGAAFARADIGAALKVAGALFLGAIAGTVL